MYFVPTLYTMAVYLNYNWSYDIDEQLCIPISNEVITYPLNNCYLS